MANITYASLLRFLTTGRLIVIMLVSSLGLVVCLYINPHHNLFVGWTLRTLPVGLCRVGYSFFSGVLLYRIFSSKTTPEVTGWYTPFVLWAILASVAALLMSAPGDAVQPYFDFITVVAVFPAIIYLALWFQPVGMAARVCKFVGAVSFAVYAIHQPLGILMQGLLKHVIGVSVEDYAPLAGLGFLAFLLPFCWFIDKTYDWPVRRFLLRAIIDKEPRSNNPLSLRSSQVAGKQGDQEVSRR